MRSPAAAVPLAAEHSLARTVLRHDLPASAVLVLIAIPLSLGIAVASGAPVMAGLIAAVVGGIVVGLLGGCRLQVSGPAAGLTVVVADLVAKYGWGVMCAITAAAGLLQMMFGISRMARAALAISPSVVHAMLAGIGITITLGQLHVLLGGAPGENAITNIAELPGQIADLHYPAAVLGLLVIAVLVIWPRLPRPLVHIPAPLAAVVGATALATILTLDLERVVLPGSVLDAVSLPELPGSNWGGVLIGVLTVAVIASVESLLSAVAVDKLSGGGNTNFDRELVGQGAANTLSGMLGGLPVTGVIVRSSANVAAGAQTRASTIAHGVWVMAFAVLFVEAIELIPLAALAGLLVVIGMRLVKLADLRCAHQQGELTIYLVTLAGVVFLNLLVGVLIGLGLSLLMVLRRAVRSGVHVQRVGSESWRVVVAGIVSFLSIPRLSRVLAQVPRGSHVVMEVVADYLDHAARDHLSAWRQQHEASGGTVIVDEIRSDRPQILLFTCADSRVAPQVVTDVAPRDVFTVRNIGHLVPPSELECGSSVAASLEYAVNHLAVPSIVVCGHSGCTAMHGLLDGATTDGSLGSWLRWGLPSLQALREGHPVGTAAGEEGHPEVDQLAMVNVARQVEVIGRHSAIRDAIVAGRVKVAGLFVDTSTGRVLRLDPEAARFVPLRNGYLATQVEQAHSGSERAGAS
ncbi:MAG TPA: SulP family inorganic anion transporter [Pseudonocardiaceae bacterium]|nr:SulP family inorganic anion transporter [Pseudonocardiaceae bacterium]